MPYIPITVQCTCAVSPHTLRSSVFQTDSRLSEWDGIILSVFESEAERCFGTPLKLSNSEGVFLSSCAKTDSLADSVSGTVKYCIIHADLLTFGHELEMSNTVFINVLESV